MKNKSIVGIDIDKFKSLGARNTQKLIDIKNQLILQEDGRCTNAFKLVSDKDILIAAYLKLKSNPGMMTPGVDEETLDGINTE